MALKKVTQEQIDRLKDLCSTEPVGTDDAHDIFADIRIAISARSKDYAKEPLAVRQFVSTLDLLEGVDSDGFSGVFSNLGPGPIRDGREFLRMHGYTEIVSVIDAAVAALPGGALPATFDELEELMVEMEPDVEDGLNAADDQYYQLSTDRDQLHKDLALHVIKHAAEFIGVK